MVELEELEQTSSVPAGQRKTATSIMEIKSQNMEANGLVDQSQNLPACITLHTVIFMERCTYATMAAFASYAGETYVIWQHFDTEV